ncbi:hypothetical protein KCU62_g66, partial [Aureobasidium sp. EXF-3399]
MLVSKRKPKSVCPHLRLHFHAFLFIPILLSSFHSLRPPQPATHPINNSKNLTFLSSVACLSFSFPLSPSSSLTTHLATTPATPLITPSLQASFPSFGNFFLKCVGMLDTNSAGGDEMRSSKLVTRMKEMEWQDIPISGYVRYTATLVFAAIRFLPLQLANPTFRDADEFRDGVAQRRFQPRSAQRDKVIASVFDAKHEYDPQFQLDVEGLAGLESYGSINEVDGCGDLTRVCYVLVRLPDGFLTSVLAPQRRT